MKIGVPREIHAGEQRVATTPDVASQLIKLGYSVAVEAGAGAAAISSISGALRRPRRAARGRQREHGEDFDEGEVEQHLEGDDADKLSARILAVEHRIYPLALRLIAERHQMSPLAIASRKDLEKFFDKEVHLELYVKVSKDWRKDPRRLKRFGYNN